MDRRYGKWFMSKTASLGPREVLIVIMAKMYASNKSYFTRWFLVFIPAFLPISPGFIRTLPPKPKFGPTSKSLSNFLSTINYTNKESSTIQTVSKTYYSSTKFTSELSSKYHPTWCKTTLFILKIYLMISIQPSIISIQLSYWQDCLNTFKLMSLNRSMMNWRLFSIHKIPRLNYIKSTFTTFLDSWIVWNVKSADYSARCKHMELGQP